MPRDITVKRSEWAYGNNANMLYDPSTCKFCIVGAIMRDLGVSTEYLENEYGPAINNFVVEEVLPGEGQVLVRPHPDFDGEHDEDGRYDASDFADNLMALNDCTISRLEERPISMTQQEREELLTAAALPHFNLIFVD